MVWIPVVYNGLGTCTLHRAAPYVSVRVAPFSVTVEPLTIQLCFGSSEERLGTTGKLSGTQLVRPTRKNPFQLSASLVTSIWECVNTIL